MPAAPRIIASLVHKGDGTWTYTRHATEILTFHSTGRLTAEKDLNGSTTTLTYPTSATIVVTDPGGRTYTIVVDPAQSPPRVTSVTDSSTPPRTVTYGYLDGAGNLTDVVDVGGGHVGAN